MKTCTEQRYSKTSHSFFNCLRRRLFRPWLVSDGMKQNWTAAFQTAVRRAILLLPSFIRKENLMCLLPKNWRVPKGSKEIHATREMLSSSRIRPHETCDKTRLNNDQWKKIWHYPTTNCSSKLYLIFAFEFSTRPNFCRPLGRHKFLPFEQQCPCT